MSKFPHISTSIFSVMSQMASQYDAINLSQGFPNFPVDPKLTSIAAKIATGTFHQYMPAAGYPPLLQKIARLVSDSYRRAVNPETEILITAGATQGIFTAIQALVYPGDEVLILDPCYDCYETPVVLIGAKPIHVSLNPDFSPNWNAISEAMSAKTKMLILNNPHNPSGKTWSEPDFEQLEKLLDLYQDIVLLSDEVYEFIMFEKPHISIHQRPKLLNRSISVSSFGKSFHITGWKIGYVIAPLHLMDEIKKVHQFLVFSVNSLAQAALSEYFDVAEIGQLSAFYQQKRDTFRLLLSETKLKLLPCEGSYFQVASYAGISDENDINFTKRLVTDFGVAAIPLSVFYSDKTDLKHVRFCFAKDDTTLEMAAERLLKL